MTIRTTILSAAVALLFSAASASAITLATVAADCDPAFGAVSAAQGGDGATGQCAAPVTNPFLQNRTDTGNINVGAPDGEFYSLGLSTPGGDQSELLLRVSPPFISEVVVIEVTNNPVSSHQEAADVFAGSLGAGGVLDLASLVFIGTVDNGQGGANAPVDTLTFMGGPFDFLLFRDVSLATFPNGNGSNDGYDIDSISVVSVIPLPASALLLLTGFAGLGFLGRRRRNATA